MRSFWQLRALPLSLFLARGLDVSVLLELSEFIVFFLGGLGEHALLLQHSLESLQDQHVPIGIQQEHTDALEDDVAGETLLDHVTVVPRVISIVRAVVNADGEQDHPENVIGEEERQLINLGERAISRFLREHILVVEEHGRSLAQE